MTPGDGAPERRSASSAPTAASPRSPTLFRTLARGAGIALMIQVGGAALRYGWQVFFARWMGAAEYGSFAFAFAWMQALAIICALGFTTGVLRFVPEYIHRAAWGRLRGIVRRSRQLTVGTGTGFAAAATIVVLFLPLAGSDRSALIVGMWLVPLLGVANLHLEITRATQNVARAYLPMRIIHPALAVVFAFLMFTGTRTLTGVQGLVAVAGSLLVTIALQQHFVHVSLPRESHAVAAEYETPLWLKESFPLLLIAGFVILLNQTDVIMVGSLASTREAGIYAAAAVTARLVNFMLLSSNAIAAPMIASLHAKNDRASLQQLVSRAARWTFWPSLAVAVVIVGASGPVLDLFGPEFQTARVALVILATGQLVNASMGPVGHLMNLTGHGKRSAVVYGVAAALNVVLNAVLIPRYGIAGSAVATAVAMATWNVWLFLLVRRHLGIGSFALAR